MEIFGRYITICGRKPVRGRTFYILCGAVLWPEAGAGRASSFPLRGLVASIVLALFLFIHGMGYIAYPWAFGILWHGYPLFFMQL